MIVWNEKYIKKNEYSNPQIKLHAVKKLVLHYTANDGATAENHFSYFNNLTGRYASAHIFVDKKEAINIINLQYIAYHANDEQKYNADGSPWRGVKELLPNANFLSIGVEMCVEKDGTFHKDTIARTEDVFVELCKRYKLDPLEDIVTHYMITAKNCPAPWVKDGSQFESFRKRVHAKLHPVIKESSPPPKTPSKPTDKTTKHEEKTPSKPKSKKKYVVLPKTEDSWRVYPTNESPVKGNEKGCLNPKKFGGLEYEILGNPQKDIYTIQTSSFGKVNIYAHSSTGAKIIEK